MDTTLSPRAGVSSDCARAQLFAPARVLFVSDDRCNHADDSSLLVYRILGFNFAQRLRSGQTVVSAAYTCESPVTEDAATAAVNSDGNIAEARFTLPGTASDGVQYTVKCTATCTAPVATKILFATIVAQFAPP